MITAQLYLDRNKFQIIKSGFINVIRIIYQYFVLINHNKMFAMIFDSSYCTIYILDEENMKLSLYGSAAALSLTSASNFKAHDRKCSFGGVSTNISVFQGDTHMLFLWHSKADCAHMMRNL